MSNQILFCSDGLSCIFTVCFKHCTTVFTIAHASHIQSTYIIYCNVYQDLVRDLKSEFSGNLGNVIIAVIDAKALCNA